MGKKDWGKVEKTSEFVLPKYYKHLTQAGSVSKSREIQIPPKKGEQAEQYCVHSISVDNLVICLQLW